MNDEGGHFSLSVQADESDALVTVVDDGSGIANDLLSRALEVVLERRGSERAYAVRIPLAAEPPRRSTPPVTYGAVPRRRILVVDDDVDRAQTLGMLVRQLGHDVQVVHDGPAALEAARFHRPHLVLIDLTMPEVNGYGVVERLRADPRFAPVQFVAVTGSDREEARRRSRDAGFVQHLVKPVEIERLRKLFERL